MSANTSDSNFSTAQEHGQWLFSAYERMNLFLERKREGEKIKEKTQKHPRIPDFKDIWASLEVCLSEYIRGIACTQSSAEQKANRGDLILSRTRSFP